VNGAIYETNLGTQFGITGTRRPDRRDSRGYWFRPGCHAEHVAGGEGRGIGVQNFFALPEIGNSWYDSTSVNVQLPDSEWFSLFPSLGRQSLYVGAGGTNTIDRPSGLMLQGINQAIGSKLNILNTVQTGTPTYSQAGAQPIPTYIFNFTGNLNSTTTVSSVSSFSNLVVGQVITGTGIPTGSYDRGHQQWGRDTDPFDSGHGDGYWGGTRGFGPQ
jgi:hypothetical protein